jgi:hypothetical protein
MCTGAAAAATATSGTDARSAAAADSGGPRLTGGPVRFKDPVLDYRSHDLTAADRGTGER